MLASSVFPAAIFAHVSVAMLRITSGILLARVDKSKMYIPCYVSLERDEHGVLLLTAVNSEGGPKKITHAVKIPDGSSISSLAVRNEYTITVKTAEHSVSLR